MSDTDSQAAPSVAQDTVPFIQAKHYKVGRQSPITLIVVHSTENPARAGVAREVASYFAGPEAPVASAHFVCGPETVIACVHEQDTAWHAPPVNDYSIGVEQTGRAAFTVDDWATDDAKAMLARSVALVASLCAKYGIPAVAVDVDGLKAGQSGITRHVDVTNAFHKTTHVDPGVGFPFDDYVASVAATVAAIL